MDKKVHVLKCSHLRDISLHGPHQNNATAVLGCNERECHSSSLRWHSVMIMGIDYSSSAFKRYCGEW